MLREVVRKLPGAVSVYRSLFPEPKKMSKTWKKEGSAGIAQLGHRLYVGGFWTVMGPLQFEFMKANGLQPHHYFLDVACGCLRAGVHFIPYLDAGHYIGLEKEAALVEAGINNELGYPLFYEKKPEILISSNFEFELASHRPDFALANSLFSHLTAPMILKCLTHLRPVIKDTGVFFATFFESALEKNNFSQSHDHARFDYTREQMEQFGHQTGWRAEYMGDWNHPSGQKMIRYEPAS